MRARSKLVELGHVEKIVDRRKKERTIKFYTGVNKGKSYPYRSKKRGAA